MEERSSTSLASAHFDAYNAQIQMSALMATRKAAGLPSDIGFHRSMDPELAQGLDIFSDRVLSMTNRLLGLVSMVDQTQGSRGKGKGKLESQDDVVDNFHSLVVDVMDQLLEKTDICLDDVSGKNKAPAIAINPPITSNVSGAKKSTIKPGTKVGRSEPVIQHAAHLAKPQLLFKRTPDNSDTPWYPTLSHKYNAKVPLGYIFHDSGEENSSVTIVNHPYRYEITHISYPQSMFTPCTPLSPSSLEDTSATWVATVDNFQRMLTKLKAATEIAVDLEHHSYRSYGGFLCLMQISDREEDWVVDLLAVREEVESLNEVFTDPAIVKVFHGAESDIVWLQQDFNIYVVNLFDTFHASKLLEFPRHGLANLLEMYCDFVPDKRYQLADWRIRPLPEDMLQYARSDTHFLLYIYDNLRNALLDRSQSRSRSPTSSPPPFASSSSRSATAALLIQALGRSAETSLRVYVKEPYDAEDGSGSGGWDTLAKRWNKIALTAGGPGVGIGALQREVYRSVHGWRERVAREEDESTRYVLQNHFLFHLAEQPPADMAALLAVFKSSVPPVIKRRMKELLSVIREGMKRGITMTHPVETEAGRELSMKEVEIEQVEPREDVAMQDLEIKNFEQAEAPTIWGETNQVSSSSSTSRSSLFGSLHPHGPSSTSAQTAVSFATPVSALFGSGIKRTSTSNILLKEKESRTSLTHFKELVVKINRSLVMGPAIPRIPTSTPQTDFEVQYELDKASGMQIEIPYMPASQRPTKRVTEEEKDTIVVVGQARQKRKRKSEKKDPEGTDGAAHASGKTKAMDTSLPKLEDVTEPFDFSAAPNILDDNPDIEDANRKVKRQRKQVKAPTFYGDFPAPPKAHSELKSGNQSHTFK